MEQERSLEELKKVLKDKYKENPHIERLFYPDSPLPLEGCYLDLALVEENKTKKIKQKNKNISTAISSSSVSSVEEDQADLRDRDHFIHAYKHGKHIQEKLEVKSILSKCKYLKKRIYIEGAAGAGKSTLSRYLANEWANDRAPWNQYEWVFYIRLRDLRIENYPTQLKELLEIVNGELFQGHGNHLKPTELNNLLQILAKKPQQVLWILDGYDELSSDVAKCNWWRDLLHSPYDLLITSRPGAKLSKREIGINLNLAVLGFNDQQVEDYVNNFFDPEYTPGADEEDAKKSLAFLKSNLNLWSLLHIPIQLELMCSIWEGLEVQQELPLTELYRLILEQLLKRQADREGIKDASLAALKEQYENSLLYMEYLAFLGMQDQKIILTENQLNQAYENSLGALKQTDFQKQLKALGLIKIYNNGKQAEFVHLTFQEFFAARYVAKKVKAFSENEKKEIWEKDLLDFFTMTISDGFYEVMWRFVAGLLGGRPNKSHQKLEPYLFYGSDSDSNANLIIPKSHQRLQNLQIFFDLLLQPSKKSQAFFELLLLMRCLDEAGFPKIMQKHTIMKHMETWFEFYAKNGDLSMEVGSLSELKRIAQFSRNMSFVESVLLRLLKQKNDKRICQFAIEMVGYLGVYASENLQKKLLNLFNETAPCKQEETEFIDINFSTSEKLSYLSVRQALVKAVGKLGGNASEELKEQVLLLLRDKNPAICQCAEATLMQLSPCISENLKIDLLELINPEKQDTCQAAIEVAGAWKWNANRGEQLIDLLLNLIESKNFDICESIIRAVGELAFNQNLEFDKYQEKTNQLIKKLLDLLRNANLKLSQLAERAIGKMARYMDDECQNILANFLENPDKNICIAALATIGNLQINVNENLQEKLLALLVRNSSVLRLTEKSIQEPSSNPIHFTIQTYKSTVESIFSWWYPQPQNSKTTQFIDNLDLLQLILEVIGNLRIELIDELKNALLLLAEKSENWEVRLLAIKSIKIFSPGMARLILPTLLNVKPLPLPVVQAFLDLEFSKELEPIYELLLNGSDMKISQVVACAIEKLSDRVNDELRVVALDLLEKEKPLVSQSITEEEQKKLDAISELADRSYSGTTKIKVSNHRKLTSQPTNILESIETKSPMLPRIPPSRLIFSSADKPKVNSYGRFDCLELCGNVLENIFQNGSSHNLTEELWTLAIVRKKPQENVSSSKGSSFSSLKDLMSHAFLVLEGVEVNGVRFAKKIDLRAVSEKASQSSHQKVIIEITEIDNLNRLKKLADRSCCIVHGISRKKAEKLLNNIVKDQERADRGEIVYSLSGDGSGASSSAYQKHSCISWCLEKWQEIGLPLKRKWYDTIVVIPSAYLEAAKESEGKCSVM